MERHRAIRRTTGGREATPALAPVYEESYRPRRETTYWYSLDPLPRQIETIAAISGAAFTGDVAADLIAAWRAPTIIVAHLPSIAMLDALGFVPAAGQFDSTLIVHMNSAKDPVAVHDVRGRSVVHDLDVYAELIRLGGEDRAEAAQRIVNEVLR